ncbi:YbaK/prolyl-tRNA synthetase associated region [Beutenbergia cavernae DSM 12333]|uniref:YbaK/prolyl-tRNA synthetase associated region n=1 Tax=Beutenbergia cavernae (strain ATCC BAA-8 / DSM 12333 / CCUG 43141 / JCM 11478 / NBRC 16432 / NCIMB 13614 / HKI 0122) TaxID=471853 RepID=C5BVF5_BEUC1|nr:YbaK/EbsC family protein [Beutenbergia cavernae]ACQ80542.1 YbaK/prolyl-tRNA synthetase associated region [Beutenbergia cavernae DSM 12333]
MNAARTPPPLGTLAWEPALGRADLLAVPVRDALEQWATTEAGVADAVLVAPIDPVHADTAAMTAAYGLELEASGNCVLVAGRRGGDERLAAAIVRATTRADVNNVIRRLLDVRKASFLATERAVADSGMEYGGITPLGLPESYRVLLDARVAVGPVIVGSGLRTSKLLLPGELLAAWSRAEVVDGLALP